MNRRDWLTGLVTSVVGAQLVINAKNAENLEGLVVPDREVKIFNQADMHSATAAGALYGEILYVKRPHGFAMIGVLTDIHEPIHEKLNFTPFGSEIRSEYPGLRTQVTGTVTFAGTSEARMTALGSDMKLLVDSHPTRRKRG